MKLEKIWKESKTYTNDKTGERVDYDAYFMLIDGVKVGFKPSKSDKGLLDYIMARQA